VMDGREQRGASSPAQGQRYSGYCFDGLVLSGWSAGHDRRRRKWIHPEAVSGIGAILKPSPLPQRQICLRGRGRRLIAAAIGGNGQLAR